MVDKDFCAKIDGDCPHKISKTKKQCFIIMAYEQHYSQEIENIFKSVIKEVTNLDPILSKDIRTRGSADMYCTKVCRPIKQATYCIADFTYNNTNVGFEVAIAQKYDKPVIITRYTPNGIVLEKDEKDILEKIRAKGIIQYSRVPNEIASDIQGIYRIDYSNAEELKQKLIEGFDIVKD